MSSTGEEVFFADSSQETIAFSKIDLRNGDRPADKSRINSSIIDIMLSFVVRVLMMQLGALIYKASQHMIYKVTI
jgi:hypothetical protein